MVGGVDDRASVLGERIAVVRSRLEGNIQRLADARSRVESIRDQVDAARSQRKLRHDAARARLEAHLAAMTVVEQAKGILMARTGCSPEEALGMLRRASKRSSRSVRELAAETVGQAAGQRKLSGLAVR